MITPEDLLGLGPRNAMGMFRVLIETANDFHPYYSTNRVEPKFETGRPCVFCGPHKALYYHPIDLHHHNFVCQYQPHNWTKLVLDICKERNNDYQSIRDFATQLWKLMEEKDWDVFAWSSGKLTWKRHPCFMWFDKFSSQIFYFLVRSVIFHP